MSPVSGSTVQRSAGRELIASLSQRKFVTDDELWDRIDPLSDDEADLVFDHCIEPHRLGGVGLGLWLAMITIAIGLVVAEGTERIDEAAAVGLLTIAPTVLFSIRRKVRRVLDARPAPADRILVVGDDDQPSLHWDFLLGLVGFGVLGGLVAVLSGSVWLAFFAFAGVFAGGEIAGFGLRMFAARRGVGPLAAPMFDTADEPYLTYDPQLQAAVEAFGR